MTYRLGIVVGHNHKRQGAASKWIPPEYEFHREQARRIVAAARKHKSLEVKAFYRRPNRSTTAEIEAVYDLTDAWGAHWTVELHYNSVANSQAHGLETLRSMTKGGRLLSERVHPVMKRSFGLRDRGIKTIKTLHQRGFQSLMAGRAPAILLEPGFGSNKRDSLRMLERWPHFAQELVAEFAA